MSISMEKQLEQLETSMEKLESRVVQQMSQLAVQNDATNRKLDSALHFLVGSEYDRGSGLVERVKNLEESMSTNASVQQLRIDHDLKLKTLTEQVSTLQKKIDRAFWVGIGMSIPAGVGVFELFKNWFMKLG